jgi:hypothetical protein
MSRTEESPACAEPMEVWSRRLGWPDLEGGRPLRVCAWRANGV